MLAHRGLHLNSAENSRTSFRQALDTGTRIIETDVHGTRDGVAIICHDSDLARVANMAATVESLHSEELMQVHISDTDTLWTLEQALTEFPNALFNIDIKDERAVEGTIDAVQRTSASDRVLITSFSRVRRINTVRDLPGVASSPSATEFLGLWVKALLGIPFTAAQFVAVQVPERYGPIRIVSPRSVRAFHRAGLEVHVWTVNDSASMRRLLDYGVDGIVTDRCDIAHGVIAS